MIQGNNDRNENRDCMAALRRCVGSICSLAFCIPRGNRLNRLLGTQSLKEMRVLSVDLGVRNLAWCVLERTPDKDPAFADAPFHGQKITVLHWRVVDIVKQAGVEEDVNLNKTDVAACVPWFVTTVEHFWDELTAGVELAVLEAQPTARVMTNGGRCISNIRTKVLSHVLQAMLLKARIPVQFVSPSVKLKDAKDMMADATDYREHKKAAIILTNRAVETLDSHAKSLWDCKGKRDDLADAFLQGVAFKIKKPTSKRAKRKRNDGFELDDVPAPDLPFEDVETNGEP